MPAGSGRKRRIVLPYHFSLVYLPVHFRVRVIAVLCTPALPSADTNSTAGHSAHLLRVTREGATATTAAFLDSLNWSLVGSRRREKLLTLLDSTHPFTLREYWLV
jgi:hypothetical protein